MVARFHYDDAVFERLLQDRLRPDEQQDVTLHVEGCTTCQSKLEVLAEEGMCWEDVRNFLTDLEQPEPMQDCNPADFNSVWIGFLEPSERPDSLGRFGRYEILEVLGRGGTGIVMRGHDPSLDRQCAIKVLSPELAASAAARKRFSREAKSAAAVVHEHVVPIQTVDEEQGLPYLVMPVLEGRSLENRVRKNGPLDVKEILRIGRQIASGLAAAHAQGLIHRDVKPANILLNHGVERVVITDFGLARAADDASMTQSSTLVGTPQYMSPEQAKGESLDVRSDLFSLGSVLYFMATGHSPFRAETTMGILNRITSDTPRSLTDHNPEIQQWFDQIVRKLLAKCPEDRYASAADVKMLLSDWLAHLQDPARVPRPSEPKTNEGNGRLRIAKWIAAALGGFFFLWAGITVVLETGKGTLTIENHANDVAVRIKQGNKIYDQLTVQKGEKDIRLAAGKYVVEIEGEHDGISIENGNVMLTRGDQKLVRIIEDRHVGIQYTRYPYSGTRPSFHSDMIKIEGDWVEIPSKDRQPSDVPLRLRIQNGGYIIQWQGKVGSSQLTEILSGVVNFGSTSRDIEFLSSDGSYFFPKYQPPNGTIYNYRFSGTYKLDDEQLVIEFDRAEVPPKFLLESIPITILFKRSSESPATFITGKDNDLP